MSGPWERYQNPKPAAPEGPDGSLLDAVRQVESGGNPRAVSRAGAMGPYQFMPATAKQLGIDPFDEGQSRAAAGKYLAQLQQQFGDPRLALTAYNWGPGNLAAWLKTGKGLKGQEMPNEARQYADKVLSARKPGAIERGADAVLSAISGEANAADAAPAQGPWMRYQQSAPKPSAPSDAAVFGNAIVKGLAGVPDAILNTPTNLWNLGKAAVGTVAGLAGRPDLMPDVSEPPSPTHRLLKRVGAISDAREPQNAGQRVLDWMGQGVGGGVISPANGIRQVMANAALGGASGAFGGAVAEGTGSTTAGILASLGAVPVAAKAGQTAVRGVRQVVGGPDVRTGRILSTAADMSPADLAAQIARGNAELVPGSKPTTWQAAQNTGISQLKRSSQSAGADFSGIEAAQNEARIAALEGMQPGTAGLTPHEAKQMAGGVLRDNYAFQRGVLKDAERGAWQNPALDGISFKLPDEGLRGAIEQYFPGSAYGEAPALLRRVVNAAENGDALSHPEVQKWRSLVGEMARDKINTDAPGRAAALAVKGVLSDMYQGAEKAGAQKFAVTGDGSFGPVYGNLAGDPENAIAHLLRTGKGEVPAAASHQFAGPVDLIAGNKNIGIKHIEARGREDVLRQLPELMKQGAWYSRPATKDTRTYLGNGDAEAAVRMEWDGHAKQWIPTAYEQYPNRRVAPETRRTTNPAGFTAGKNSAGQLGNSSIDDILSQMLGESSAARIPAPPVFPLRDPRAYSPNLISPQQAGLLNDARFLTTTRKERFETGPAKGLLDVGSDGLPKKQGAEAFDLFFNPKASQSEDIAALGRAFPGNPEVWNAMRTGTVADLLGSTINNGTGLLSNAKLQNYTKARSGALKGLLSDEQMGTLDAVKADAMRADTAENLGRVRGSDTAQKLLGAGMLENPWVTRGAALLPRLGPAAVDWLKTIVRTHQARRVGEALIDPETARRVLAAYEIQQRPTVFDSAGARVTPGVGLGLLGNANR